MINLSEIRSQFKALNQTVNGRPLVYLDSAATALKPTAVIDRMSYFYNHEAANVHRGAHYLSDLSTQHFEAARETIKAFINASGTDEIIFTSGTTSAINLVATSFGESQLNAGDEIVITELEHHANLVPWQNLAQKKNLKLKYIPVNAKGDLDLTKLAQIITDQTKLVSFTGCSNLLGTIPNYEKIIERAQAVGAKTLMDAAQLVTQKKIDVQKLNVDFLVFSAHKLFGPFGFGVLYGKRTLLEQMPPYQFGGSMISEVQFERSTYNVSPFKFEAGTPNISSAIGTAKAIDFFNQLNIEDVYRHEQSLMSQAKELLSQIPEIEIYPAGQMSAGLFSFNLKGAHHSDVGQILDQQGVAVRVGHHCVQPLLKKMGLSGTIRASFSIYNNSDDVEALYQGLQKVRKMLL